MNNSTLHIQFKTCCVDCRHRKTIIDENRLNTLSGPYATYTTINCEHQEVCGRYARTGTYIAADQEDKKPEDV